MIEGTLIADVIAALGSMDFVWETRTVKDSMRLRREDGRDRMKLELVRRAFEGERSRGAIGRPASSWRRQVGNSPRSLVEIHRRLNVIEGRI